MDPDTIDQVEGKVSMRLLQPDTAASWQRTDADECNSPLPPASAACARWLVDGLLTRPHGGDSGNDFGRGEAGIGFGQHGLLRALRQAPREQADPCTGAGGH